MQSKNHNTADRSIEAKNYPPKSHTFKKSDGTSGVKGQLYETKLLTLFLHRLLNDDAIEEFVIGSNIHGLGAMDDIVLRYKKKQSQKSKLIFLQTKHKDDTNRYKLTFDAILNIKGDFSFKKYFESYLNIKRILLNQNNNVMFRGPSNDIDVEFIIYTSAKANIPNNKLTKALDFESVIKTGESIFQLKCNDQEVKDLLKSVRDQKERASLLAKSVADFIKKKNYTKIMDDCIIKEYHIFLSLNVISEDEKNTKSSSYYTGKFSDYFLNSKIDYLILMKEVLRNKLRDTKNADEQQEVDILETCRFKLPIDFGNRNFRFNGSEEQQAESLNDMCQIFRSLICFYEPDFEIKVDDNSIGPDEVIERKWLGEHWLGGLVGNLLINDGETEILKFNLKEETLSPDNLNILRNLNQHYDLSKFRFNINIDGFPKTNLFSTRDDPELVHFLSILKFYTNQAQENEVEEIIKNEINCRYLQDNLERSLFREKKNLIYLMVHDKIQKWWMTLGKAIPYLTNTCNYYKQAEQELKEHPLIHFISLPFKEDLKNMPFEFDSEAISSLSLDKFLKSHKKVLVILSDERFFSIRKVIQYFENIMTLHDCICIHLDSILIKNSLDTLKQELKHATNPVLILTVQDQNDITNHCKTMEQFITLFNGKIIIIADSVFEWDMMAMTDVFDIHIDSKNKFTDFSYQTQNNILKSKVIFQGVEVSIDNAFNNSSLDIFSPKLLKQMIYNKFIELGQSLNNKVYCKTMDFFIDRNLCQYMTLNIDEYKDKFCYLEDEQTECMLLQKGNKLQKENDIIINTDLESMFQKICECNPKSNVHWFERRDGHKNLIWKKTRGSLHNLIKYIKSDLHKDFMLHTKTLNNIQEKIVIISSGPGMGKSTLLNHLAMETKRQHPNLWIINVNLLDNSNQLSNWKDKKTEIDLMEAFKFLCSLTINTKHLKNSDGFDVKINEDKEFLKSISVNGDQICFTNPEKKISGVDLSERKLLVHFYNNNSLAVLIDGFDEICPDYSNEVKKLLCTLKHSKVAHLWLASRPCNMLTQLELALETFPFSLSPLTSMEQSTVLGNIWSKKLALPKNVDNLSMDNFYHHWINIEDVLKNFTSIPLHLYMVSKVFQDYYMAYLNYKETYDMFSEATNLTTLYEKFTNIKFFEIRFGRRKRTMNIQDPFIKQIKDDQFKLFVENHKKSAAYYLLDKRLVLSETDIKHVQKFLNNIQLNKAISDIISCPIDNRPKFIHYTFAEYYASEHIFDKLISLDIKCVTYFLNHMLKKDKYVGIRRFINSKLQRNKDIVAALESAGPFGSIVFNTLYAQNVSSTKTALFVNINENLEATIEFLLNSVQSCITVDNVSYFLKTIHKNQNCAICTAIKEMKKTTLLNFVKLVSNIDTHKLKDLLYCLTTMKRGSFELIDEMRSVILLVLKQGNLDPRLFVAILTSRFQYSVNTPAHWFGSDTRGFQFIWDRLPHLNKKQLFKIFSIRDEKGYTPLHNAAVKNDYSFFDMIYELLGQKYFKKLCLMKSHFQYITVCAFSFDETYFEKLKTLLEIIYEERDIDVKDYVFNKLSKLHPRDLSRIPRIRYQGTRGTPDSPKEFDFFIEPYDCMVIHDCPHKHISMQAYKSNITQYYF